jgi:acyl carrier protein
MHTEIRNKILELARRRGLKTATIADDEVIPETGLLDSAGLMELIVWIETRFDIEIDQADVTIDNLGTIGAIVEYVTRAHARPVA